MTKPTKFFDEIGEAVAAFESDPDAGVRIRRMRSDESLWADGFVTVEPLWNDGLVKVGLLAIPNADPLDWRGIIISDGEAITLSQNAQTILPRYLLLRFLANNASGLKKLAGNWRAAAPLLRDLHAKLGGDPKSLQCVGSVIEDTSGHPSFKRDPAAPKKFEVAFSAVARRIDPSSEFTVFADWIDRAIGGSPERPARLDEMGPWARLCFCWSNRLLRLENGEKSDWARDVIETLPGLDAGAPDRPTWELRPGMTSAEVTIVSLADHTILGDSKGEATYRRIVEAIRDQALEYDGVAHAEAVAAYDEAGDPDRALGALTAAAWWMARRLGEPVEAISRGIHLLCDNHGWDDLRWVADNARRRSK